MQLKEQVDAYKNKGDFWPEQVALPFPVSQSESESQSLCPATPFWLPRVTLSSCYFLAFVEVPGGD